MDLSLEVHVLFRSSLFVRCGSVRFKRPETGDITSIHRRGG